MSVDSSTEPITAAAPWWAQLRGLFADVGYRRYWAASASFGLGIWAWLTAMGWSAKQLSDTAFGVSMVSVVYFLPFFLFALPSGLLADVANRKTTAVVVRAGGALGSAVLVFQAATGGLTYRWLLVHAFIVGCSVILELTARQAYLTHLVPMDMLVRASALSAVHGGMSRFLGPLLAGALISRFDDAGGYAILLASNVFFVLMFLRIPVSGAVPAEVDAEAKPRPVAEIIAGFRYLGQHRDALALVGISILAGVVGWIHVALMPLVAEDVLGGDAVTLGLLSTALGLGSVPPSISLAVKRRLVGEGRLFIVAMLLWGGAIMAFPYAGTIPLSVLALGVAGLGFGFQSILTRTILLRIVDPAFHGRVMGTLMLTWGANIVGTLVGGRIADLLGVQTVIAMSGGMILAVTLGILAWNPRLWRV